MTKDAGIRRICLACDLKDDPTLIEEYIDHHQSENVWPEIKESIFAAGVVNMQIYRIEHRLMMIMDVDESFDLDRKAAMDAANPKVQEWEALMWNYQAGLPWAPEGVKWMVMEQIFQLD